MKISINKSVLIILLLYIFSTFYIFTLIKGLGFIAMSLVLSLPLINVLLHKKIRKNKMLIIVLLISVYNIFLLTSDYRGIKSLYYCVLQILIIAAVVCADSLEICEYKVIYFCSYVDKIAAVILIYNFILKIINEYINISYSTNKYAMRTVLFGMLLIGLYAYKGKRKHFYIRLIVYSMIFFILTERTMALGMLFVPMIFYLIGKITKKIFYRFFFAIYVGLLLSFPYFYVELYKTPYAIELNRIVNYYTHKNLFSGRQSIWNMAMELIKERPLSGYGIGAYSFAYNEVQMSVHNIYLYFLLQGGVINLILIILFFYIVYDRMYCYKNEYYGRLSISILLMVMLLGDFGLILFANDILYSLFLWTAVSIGLIKRKCCNCR